MKEEAAKAAAEKEAAKKHKEFRAREFDAIAREIVISDIHLKYSIQTKIAGETVISEKVDIAKTILSNKFREEINDSFFLKDKITSAEIDTYTSSKEFDEYVQACVFGICYENILSCPSIIEPYRQKKSDYIQKNPITLNDEMAALLLHQVVHDKINYQFESQFSKKHFTILDPATQSKLIKRLQDPEFKEIVIDQEKSIKEIRPTAKQFLRYMSRQLHERAKSKIKKASLNENANFDVNAAKEIIQTLIRKECSRSLNHDDSLYTEEELERYLASAEIETVAYLITENLK